MDLKHGESTAAITPLLGSEFEAERNEFKASDLPHGTTVICRLLQNVVEEYYVDSELIRTSILNFVRILPIPVFFNETLLNPQYIAWTQPRRATIQDWRDAICALADEDPLYIIPVFSPPSELDFYGALWIPRRERVLSESRIDVFVKRMFVMSDACLVAPAWAKFISGMINSNKLKRIVSGQTVKDNAICKATRDLISQIIIDTFGHLRSLPDDEYWRIIGPHDDTIKESAADDQGFLQHVWDKLTLRVRSRRLTIPEYMSAVARVTRSDGAIFYYDVPSQEFSAHLVADATGIPVLSLTGRADYYFVKRVSDWQNYEMLSFRAIADEHFPAPQEAESYRGLISACAESNIAAEVRNFEPNHVPAVLIEDTIMMERRENLLRELRQHGERRFVEDLAKLFYREKAANRGVAFYLNSSNDMIRELRDASYDAQVATCLALYHISYMSAMPELRKAEVQAIYTSISSVLAGLLRESKIQSEHSPSTPRAHRAAPPTRSDGLIRAFVIMPFSPEYQDVERAIKQVFQLEPYFFDVVLARDVMYESGLLAGIKAHMEAADLFIADITSLNPNVMFELGAVLMGDDRKPVFSLRAKTAIGDVPADLRAELYIDYGSPTDSVSDIAKAIRGTLERNGKISHREMRSIIDCRRERALSRALLESTRFRLSDIEISSILKHFPSVEAFLAVSNEEIAQRTGMKEREVVNLQEELRERFEQN